MTRLAYAPAIFVLLSAFEPAVAGTLAPQIDWVPYHELTLEQQSNRAPYCSGQFVEPVWQGLSLDPSGDPDVMVLHAQKLEFKKTDYWIASGKADLTNRNMQFAADSISFDVNTSASAFEKDVSIRLPGTAITGSDAVFDVETNVGKVNNSFFVIHGSGFSGWAANVSMETDGYYLFNASITPCDPNNPAWQIKASSVHIDNDKGVAEVKNARIHIGSIPVIYTPYLSIPIDDKRHSGFLSPAFSVGYNNGDLTVNAFSAPYYWNIAPQIDNTLTPFYQINHSWFFDNETRYLTDAAIGVMNVGWNPTESRWMVAWDHEQSLAWETTLIVDWNRTSDNGVAVDFQSAAENTKFDHQGVTLSKSAWRSDMLFTLERWQPVDLSLAASEKPYAKQPGINISGDYWFTDQLTSRWIFDATQFSRNLSVAQMLTLNQNNGDTAEGLRAASSITWSAPMTALGWRMTPNARASMATYELTNPGNSRPESTAWIQPTIWLTLDRPLPLGFQGQVWENALKPKFQWVYSRYNNQYEAPLFDTTVNDFGKAQLFETQRFSGMDRAGDMNRFSSSISDTLVHVSSGQKFTANLAQIIRLTPEKMGLKSDVDISVQPTETPIYASVQWEPNAAIDLQAEVDWNTIYGHEQRTAFDASYAQNSKNYHLRFEREWALPTQQITKETAKLSVENNIQQRLALETIKTYAAGKWQEDIIASGFTPFAQQWGLAASIDFDNTASTLNNSLFGIEYDSCCWNLRLLTKINWLTINDTLPLNSLFFEFTLKGLVQNVGQVESILSNHIDGYNGRIYR